MKKLILNIFGNLIALGITSFVWLPLIEEYFMQTKNFDKVMLGIFVMGIAYLQVVIGYAIYLLVDEIYD